MQIGRLLNREADIVFRNSRKDLVDERVHKEPWIFMFKLGLIARGPVFIIGLVIGLE